MAQYKNAIGDILSDSGTSKNTFTSQTSGASLVGTAGNDTLRGFAGTYTYSGGAGDDTYILGSAKDVVVESPGGGIDTVRSYYNTTLTDNVENLYLLGKNAWYGGGNSLNNIIVGDENSQQLDGGAGNDVLTGGGGADTFIIRAGNGSDLITDFKSGVDQVRLYDYGITNFDQVKSSLAQVGNDAVLTFANGEKLVFANTAAADLKATDFQLQMNPSSLKLTFADEFDSLSLYSQGGTWRTEYGYGGVGTISSRTLNSESEIYMEDGFKGTSDHNLGVNPFSVSNGILTITAAPTAADVLPYVDGHTYTSGLITSKFTFSQEYGYFEIRAKLPEGQGFWPAFWMLPTDNSWPPELDIFEQLGKDPSTVYLTTHFTNGSVKNDQTQNVLHLDTTQFHTYGVDWGPQKITFYVDGVAVAQQNTPASMNKEMFFLANLAVGGSWAGAPDATTGTGQMQIDYIRAYQTANTVSTTINGVHTVYSTASTTTSSSSSSSSSSSTSTTTTPTTTNSTPTTATTSSSTSTTTTTSSTSTATTSTTSSATTSSAYQQLKGTAADNTMVGSSTKQEFWGLEGNDTLRGGSGGTIMHGGLGNDSYYVTSSNHVVQENAGEGTDSVNSTISYTLTANVENLVLAGSANINGTGNDLDNRIIGNTGDNVITGGAGNDQLDGGTAGKDTLIGGAGDDVYMVNHVGTTLVEAAGQGQDSVQTTISFTLSANIENMTLLGTANINGTGNDLANRIVGNSGDNIITGLGGNDTLTSGGGHDTFIFGAGFGKDVITDFSAADDVLKFTGVDKSALHVAQVGSSVVIDFGGTDSVTLLNTKVTDPNLMSHILFY